MYVHIGDDIVIRTDQIIAILDKKVISSEEPLFNDYQKISATIVDRAKSVIITREQVYFSPIAPLTLKKRIN